MARDFRYRADPASSRPTSTWKVFAAGFAAGVVSLGAIWIGVGRQDCGKPQEASTHQYVPPPDVVEQQEQRPVAPTGPEFTYPEILAKQKVVTPVDEGPVRFAEPPPSAAPQASAAPAPAHPAPAVPESGMDALMLQVAAFTTPADAESLKARLVALGLPAQIQSATIKGERFYRVRLGPYRSTDQLEQHRSRLRSNGYSSDVVRVK